MLNQRGSRLIRILVLLIFLVILAAGVAVGAGMGRGQAGIAEGQAEACRKRTALGNTVQAGQWETVSETLDQRTELVIQEAQHMKEIRENEAYFASIPTLPAGQIIDTARLSADQLTQLFYGEEIRPEGSVYSRINGCSYRENSNIALSQLRYLRVLHVGFDGRTHVGEMIVNEEIAGDVLEILEELYKAGYPIERMQLVDDYQADDNASMAANNSSAFNYRYIANTTRLSNHSWGRAVDMNPFYNPYLYTSGGQLHVEPQGAEAYADRNGDCPYLIDHEDLCYRLFTERGFEWGGDWNSRKDYQHFEKN